MLTIVMMEFFPRSMFSHRAMVFPWATGSDLPLAGLVTKRRATDATANHPDDEATVEAQAVHY